MAEPQTKLYKSLDYGFLFSPLCAAVVFGLRSVAAGFSCKRKGFQIREVGNKFGLGKGKAVRSAEFCLVKACNAMCCKCLN